MMGVYAVIERRLPGGERRMLWLKVGTCITNRDGSLSVLLDAYPKDGKLRICASLPPGAEQVKG